MRYTITGDILQFANIEIGQDEEIYSRAGAMSYMTGNVTMEAKPRGGIIRRKAEDAIPMLRYKPHGGTGIVGLCGNVPGRIFTVGVENGAWMCQISAYLASEPGVVSEIALHKKIDSPFFGDGFTAIRLSGAGTAFISACGDFNTVTLKEGQQYKVFLPKAAAWEEFVKYEISSAGGPREVLDDGVFIATFTGPGKVVIQSMSAGDAAALPVHRDRK